MNPFWWLSFVVTIGRLFLYMQAVSRRSPRAGNFSNGCCLLLPTNFPVLYNPLIRLLSINYPLFKSGLKFLCSEDQQRALLWTIW
jgi:hypothetical protein